jgi:hypothetical protein
MFLGRDVLDGPDNRLTAPQVLAHCQQWREESVRKVDEIRLHISENSVTFHAQQDGKVPLYR